MLDGTKIKLLRLLHNKTQRQVAEGAGVSVRYIKYIEHCQKYPNEEYLQRILDAIYSNDTKSATGPTTGEEDVNGGEV